jgi:hypothetical protein
MLVNLNPLGLNLRQFQRHPVISESFHCKNYQATVIPTIVTGRYYLLSPATVLSDVANLVSK